MGQVDMGQVDMGQKARLERGSVLSGEADHPFHVPVLREVLEALGAEQGGRYVDATFGAGGYGRGHSRPP